MPPATLLTLPCFTLQKKETSWGFEMWDDFSDRLSNVWEFLASAEGHSASALDIHRGTGVSLVNVISSLRELEEVSLVSCGASAESKSGSSAPASVPAKGRVASDPLQVWALKKNLSSMDWARAVEVGVSLSCLEKTSSLSVKEKREASTALVSGLIDEERSVREGEKLEARKKVVRGRAATRAAATDLAKIVEDAQKALAASSSPISDVFRKEAQKALESLISAMENKK